MSGTKAAKAPKAPKTSKRQLWDEARATILDAIDVRAEYESWGVVTSGDPSDEGWVKAHAYGRDDRTPSAGINVGVGPARGLYKDFANPGADGSLTFFYAAAAIGPYDSPREAIKHYAKLHNIELPEDIEDQLDFLPWVESFAVMFAKLKGGGIAAPSLSRAGARRSKWPKTSLSPQSVLAFPIFGPALVNADPTGWVLVSQNAQPVRVFQGKDKEPRLEKTHTLKGSKSGLMNRAACAAIIDGTAEVIWKVEGVSDMLALDSLIPDDLRGKHVVVTNSAGAAETPRADFVKLFAGEGKTVNVIHDADEPGQLGATKWVSALAGAGVTVRNIPLPYPEEKNHGKDLRDWIGEGHTYEDLLALAESITPAAKDDPNTTTMGEEALLRRLGLDILGELENGQIRGYSVAHKKVVTVPAVDRLGYATLLQLCGPAAKEQVKNFGEPDDDPRTPLNDVRNAIGFMAGFRRLSDETMYGTGCWPIGGDTEEVIAVVNGGAAATWNGSKKLIPSESPVCRGKILDLSNSEPWVDFKELERAMHAAEDHAWCEEVFKEATKVISMWHWRHETDPQMVAGLIMATYVQTFFSWRPQVAMLGQAATGKTTFFQLLERIFGKLAITGSKPTEAGVRQAVHNTSRAIVIDEFEEDKHRQQVLELIRTSSRGESSAILRGSQDQRGRRFSLRQICWVAAIEIGLKRDPDRSRFIQFELLPPKEELRGKLILPNEVDSRALGVKLLACALRHVWEARRWAVEMKSMRVEGASDRVIESYSVPVAMIAAATGHGLDGAKTYLSGVLKDRDLGGTTISDQEDLVDAIMGGWVHLDHGKRATVSEILSGDFSDANQEGTTRALEAHGITRSVPDSDSRRKAKRETIPWTLREIVFVDFRTVAEKVLRGSRWQQQSLDQILMRLPGAKRNRRMIASRQARGIDIPIASFGLEKSQEEEF